MAYGEKQTIGRSGYAFQASYDGDCHSPARDTIDAGESIVMVEGEPWHEQCARDAGYRVPQS